MIRFDDINIFAESIDDLVVNEGINVHVVGKHEFIKELFNHLIVFNEYEADSVIMPSPYDTNYDKELMLTIYDGNILDVTTIYDYEDDCYNLCNSDCCITYVHKSCDSKLLKADEVILFGVNDYDTVSSASAMKIDTSASNDGHTISQTVVNDDGSTYYKSFYSDDLSLVKSMMEGKLGNSCQLFGSFHIYLVGVMALPSLSTSLCEKVSQGSWDYGLISVRFR